MKRKPVRKGDEWKTKKEMLHDFKELTDLLHSDPFDVKWEDQLSDIAVIIDYLRHKVLITNFQLICKSLEEDKGDKEP